MGVSRPAVMVPDEGTWLLWGHDLRASGLQQVVSPARATALVAPATAPDDVLVALRDAWGQLPAGRELVVLEAPIAGEVDTRDALEQDGSQATRHDEHQHHGDHEGHGDHEAHGDHDHHAMMAVTGDPSADGLVMEDLEVSLGPVTSALPAGVVARFTLDGDVVCEAQVRPSFSVGGDGIPDPTSPAAWHAALAAVRGDDGGWIAGVELERARSHARWFMSLGAVLGWAQLTDRARATARDLAALACGGGQPGAARHSAARLAAVVRSRRLRVRLAGVAVIDRESAIEARLDGPNARASGVETDARIGHPAYEALQFAPVTEHAGDAHARALVRAGELEQALGLFERARSARPATAPPVEAGVEGPGGIVLAHPADTGGEPSYAAPGAAIAFRLAGESTRQLEWPDAVLALVSFDLSGWRVG